MCLTCSCHCTKSTTNLPNGTYVYFSGRWMLQSSMDGCFIVNIVSSCSNLFVFSKILWNSHQPSVRLLSIRTNCPKWLCARTQARCHHQQILNLFLKKNSYLNPRKDWFLFLHEMLSVLTTLVTFLHTVNLSSAAESARVTFAWSAWNVLCISALQKKRTAILLITLDRHWRCIWLQFASCYYV